MTLPLDLPATIYRLACDRAGGAAALHDRIVAYVTAYARGETAQQRGGTVSASRLTPEERSERARRAVKARKR